MIGNGRVAGINELVNLTYINLLKNSQIQAAYFTSRFIQPESIRRCLGNGIFANICMLMQHRK